MEISKKIELHYYFNNDSHTMDAIIRHECEKELLSIYKEVIDMLDINVKIESEAFSEGGLKEVWKFLGENSQQLTLLVTVLVAVYSRIPVENKELVHLQIENLKLDNEIKKNDLKKIKNDIKIDERTTLYWNPYLITTAQNKSINFSFFNSDKAKKFKVIIEGFLEDGKLLHIEKIIE